MTATFLGLPTELKKMVVKYVHNQDERYREINKSNRHCMENWKLAASTFDGKSLNALFMVNRELSDLAAVHIFHSVKAAQCLQKSWRYGIMARRGRHIRHLDLLPAGHVANADVISAIIEQSTYAMTNIESMLCHASFERYWLSNDRVDPDDQEGFTTLTSRLVRASLLGLRPESISSFLDLTLNLTSFTTDSFLSIRQLHGLLSSHSKVQHVELLGGIASISPEQVQQIFVTPIATRSLAFRLRDLSGGALEGALQFAAACGRSLESLEIDVTSANSKLLEWVAPELTMPDVFANLAQLTITGTPRDDLKILEIFSSAPLRTIELRLSGKVQEHSQPVSPDIFPQSAQLLVIRENANVLLGRSGWLSVLFRPGGARGPSLTQSTMSEALSITTWRGAWREKSYEYDLIVRNVEELGTWAANAANRHREMGDFASLMRVMKSLEPLIALRDLATL